LDVKRNINDFFIRSLSREEKRSRIEMKQAREGIRGPRRRVIWRLKEDLYVRYNVLHFKRKVVDKNYYYHIQIRIVTK